MGQNQARHNVALCLACRAGCLAGWLAGLLKRSAHRHGTASVVTFARASGRELDRQQKHIDPIVDYDTLTMAPSVHFARQHMAESAPGTLRACVYALGHLCIPSVNSFCLYLLSAASLMV